MTTRSWLDELTLVPGGAIVHDLESLERSDLGKLLVKYAITNP